MTHPTRTAMWSLKEASKHGNQIHLSHYVFLKNLRLSHCCSALYFCAILLWDEFSHEILSFLTAIAKRLVRNSSEHAASNLWSQDGNRYRNTPRRSNPSDRERLNRREVSKAPVSMWRHGIHPPVLDDDMLSEDDFFVLQTNEWLFCGVRGPWPLRFIRRRQFMLTESDNAGQFLGSTVSLLGNVRQS